MPMTNMNIPSGTKVVVASANPVDYFALQVITASDLVYVDALGQTTTLTAAPVGLLIVCRIVKVTTCSGVVLGSQGG